MQALSTLLARHAREVAERLARHGARAWIVGGAVRDLALGREVADVDMASRAAPDIVEQEFERTIPLGRSFGTVVIHLAGADIEHTTFRREDGYQDGRHPGRIEFGATIEEDASRRDFLCNALYLDPLTNEVGDPCGGLAELAAGRLSCVGDPSRRFNEDGLRIVRLARFAGQLGLQPTPDTIAAAQTSLGALRGVSRERLRLEFESSMTRGDLGIMLANLELTGALDTVLPGWNTSDRRERVTRTLRHLPAQPGVTLGFALLFDPEICPDETPDRAAARLADLRPARALLDHVRGAWQLSAEFRAHPAPTRATRIRWLRRPECDTALALISARAQASGSAPAGLEALRAERARYTPLDLTPAPLLTAADLAAHGLKPGPLYGTLLGEIETLQLELEITGRDEALQWLAARLQDGGNTRRNA
ncbi:MAG: CCA tRNA nucleotidyltransferase [Planctomycetes bacterium]|nr:CCA tRNA nucleotidyltransferase [Planctomycetota bacterium]